MGAAVGFDLWVGQGGILQGLGQATELLAELGTPTHILDFWLHWRFLSRVVLWPAAAHAILELGLMLQVDAG